MTDPDHGVDLLLRRATDGLRPDVDRLVAGGITRGRTRQRHARIGRAVVVAAICGVVGAGAVAAPHLGASGPRSADSGFATDSPSPAPTPTPTPSPTAVVPTLGTLTVAGADIPGTVDRLLGTSSAGPVLTEPPYGVKDGPHMKTVSFLYAGMLTTVIIEPFLEATLVCPKAPCPAATDGALITSWGPDRSDGVTAQGVMVWRQGYGITINSYNAAAGKDSPPLAPAPPLSLSQLEQIAGSEAWFS